MTNKNVFSVNFNGRINDAVAVHPATVKPFTSGAYIPFKKEFLGHDVMIVVLKK